MKPRLVWPVEQQPAASRAPSSRAEQLDPAQREFLEALATILVEDYLKRQQAKERQK